MNESISRRKQPDHQANSTSRCRPRTKSSAVAIDPKIRRARPADVGQGPPDQPPTTTPKIPRRSSPWPSHWPVPGLPLGHPTVGPSRHHRRDPNRPRRPTSRPSNGPPSTTPYAATTTPIPNRRATPEPHATDNSAVLSSADQHGQHRPAIARLSRHDHLRFTIPPCRCHCLIFSNIISLLIPLNGSANVRPTSSPATPSPQRPDAQKPRRPRTKSPQLHGSRTMRLHVATDP